MNFSRLLFLNVVFGVVMQASFAFALPTNITATNALDEARVEVPVSWSIPLANLDAVLDPASLRLTRDGLDVPAQFSVMSRWNGAPSDFSKPISWLLVDTRVSLGPSETAAFTLTSGQPQSLAGLNILQNDANGLVISTGVARFTLSRTAFQFFEQVELTSGATFGAGRIFFNNNQTANPATISIEHQGSERISLLVRGTVSGALKFTARIHFYRGLSESKIDFRLENSNEPVVSGGQPNANNYGSPRSISFNDLSIGFGADGSNLYWLPTGELGTGVPRNGVFASSLVVTQESSGDSNWNALQDSEPRLQGGVSKRASSLTIDGVVQSGPNQIAGWLDAGNVTVAVERAWQNFPKSLRAFSNRTEVALFPGEYSQNHELRAGEYKTHTLWVRYHVSGAGDIGNRARSALNTVRLLVSPSELMRTNAAGPVAPRNETDFFAYEKGTDLQVRPPTQADANECSSKAGIACEIRSYEHQATDVFDAISRYQQYGWVDYGDVPTDFEAEPSYAYNLKYDAVRGLILHALRSANSNESLRWWELASSAARHAADIDIQHSAVSGPETERAWFQGGMYGHLYHDESGADGENPHRNLGNPTTQMSGPAAGIILWALISGDTLALQSGIEVADNSYWRAANSHYAFFDEDGQYYDFSATAKAAGLQQCNDENSCRGYEALFGNRSAANAVNSWLLAYQATGDTRYLNQISRLTAFIEAYQTSISNFSNTKLACNRFHFEATYLRAVAQYLHFRQTTGLSDDSTARALLSRRVEYMTSQLWNPALTQPFRICYVNDQAGETLFENVNNAEFAASEDFINNNWLLAVADVFGMAALVLERPNLLTQYGKRVFDFGATNQFYPTSTLSYHFSKEFVNQVGFGNMFLYAWGGGSGGGNNPPSPAEAPALYRLRLNKRSLTLSAQVINPGFSGCRVQLQASFSPGSGFVKLKTFALTPNDTLRDVVRWSAKVPAVAPAKNLYVKVLRICNEVASESEVSRTRVTAKKSKATKSRVYLRALSRSMKRG